MSATPTTPPTVRRKRKPETLGQARLRVERALRGVYVPASATSDTYFRIVAAALTGARLVEHMSEETVAAVARGFTAEPDGTYVDCTRGVARELREANLLLPRRR